MSDFYNGHPLLSNENKDIRYLYMNWIYFVSLCKTLPKNILLEKDIHSYTLDDYIKIINNCEVAYGVTIPGFDKFAQDLEEYIYGSLPGQPSFMARTKDRLFRMCGPDLTEYFKLNVGGVLYYYHDEYPRLLSRAKEFSTRVNVFSSAIKKLQQNN